MIVYLDTNAYIGAKYIFDSGNFGTLKNLVAAGKMSVLYTSATIGEVKQHIKHDMSAAVTKYNRTLRNDMPVLNGDQIYNLKDLDKNQVVNSVIDKLNQFIGLDGVEQISLNPLDAEKLLDDYFNQILPFESKKPNEFKDAIMINAIKKFQATTQKIIYIVSNDEGFRKTFEDDDNFIALEFISNFLGLYNKSEEKLARISGFLLDTMLEGDFDDVIKEYLLDLDIDRGYYAKWHCDGVEIDELCLELLYIEEIDGKYVTNISTDVEISIDITYRDENTSYYDREEDAYLIEYFIHAIEKHRVTIAVTIVCDIEEIEEELYLNNFYVAEDKRLKYINLDEDTMLDSEEIENNLHEEDDLVYCSECSSLLGRTRNGAYFDYAGNPLCSNCAVSNSSGDICPMCGVKVPCEYMMSGFCKNCSTEVD